MINHRVHILLIGFSVFVCLNVVCIPSLHAQQRAERQRNTGTSGTSGGTSGNFPSELMVPNVGLTDTETPPIVKIWTDKGDNTNSNRPIYYIGEQIYVSFQTDKDCYVTIYDIDSIGNVNILFPNPYHPDNLVRRGRTYTLPSDISQYNFILRGPSGIEGMFAIAATYVYFHWRYGETSPPIWLDQWGSPSTWGHPGGGDESVVSRRFERRLQEQPYSMVNSTMELIESEVRLKIPMSVAVDYGAPSVKTSWRIPGTDTIIVWDRQNAKNHLQVRRNRKELPVGFARCEFYVTPLPY